MAQPTSSVQNNFTKGLITEFSGLNFPENAAVESDNVRYELTGDVTRRLGIDLEHNKLEFPIDSSSNAINTFKWENAGGDGNTQILVVQVGAGLLFYRYSDITASNPVSGTKLASNVLLDAYHAAGNINAIRNSEAQFTAGNGYLFVFHPDCEPFYCTYNPTTGNVTSAVISMKVRDIVGVSEPGVAVDYRPTTLTDAHLYNIYNQGWTSSAAWSAGSSTNINYTASGGATFDIGTSTLPITPGDVLTFTVEVPGYEGATMGAIVNTYAGNLLTVTRTSISAPILNLQLFNLWLIQPANNGHIDVWHTAVNNYPSNGDVWWTYKDTTGLFSPSTTYQNRSVNIGPAPKGHFILDVFNQQRGITAAVNNITPITTTHRPSTGTWFQGRVWYAGVNAVQPPVGNALQYSWTETIYFSQVVVTTDDFGKCFQTNDPTSEELFDALPTDGGTVTIQGCGAIYKLFPIQNGLLVFAANGVYFITGSQGIGFSANDYTTSKISAVQCISGTSFVNVQGFPFFWNMEGIYSVSPSEKGGLTVEPITVGTILSFFNEIPKASRKYARGDYNAIDYVIQWVYCTQAESGLSSRYRFDGMLNYNVYNKAFYPFSVSLTSSGVHQPFIHGINYIVSSNPGIAPDPTFKYLSSYYTSLAYAMSFAAESSENYYDWESVDTTQTIDYDSYFITGYSLAGKALRKFMVNYLNVFARQDTATGYKIQGIWDYANSPNSGRWSTLQRVTNALARFGMVRRRHKIRGSGYSLQLKFSNNGNLPFDIMGWSIDETVNAGN